MVDLFVLGVAMQGDGQTPLLLLHPYGTERILPVDVNSMEAFAVSAALHAREHGLEDPLDRAPLPQAARDVSGADRDPEAEEGEVFAVRPTSHDLLLRVIRAMGGKLLRIDLRLGTGDVFLAEAALAHNSTLIRALLRPADGAALALRSGAPLRAAPSCLSRARDFSSLMGLLPARVRSAIRARMAAQVLRVCGEDRAAPVAPEPDKRVPTIRVSLVRQDKRGEIRVLDEFQFPTGDVPQDVLQHLRRPLARAASGCSREEERWAALLRILVPETKVPM